MRLFERHVIDKNHQHWTEIDDLSFKAKNLYNLSNYHCRQRFFAEHKAWGLNDLYHLTKDSDAYWALPTKVSKQILTSSPPWNGRGFLLEQAELLILLVG